MIILIVEDDALIAMALQMLLCAAGYRVLGPAASVQEALELVSNEEPDIAFVDVNLAGDGDGLSLARLLAERLGTTIVFLTARPDEARKARETALGVVSKPYGPRTVLRAVEIAAATRMGLAIDGVPPGLELFR
jgi:DNA-binding response OmpR family regulator